MPPALELVSSSRLTAGIALHTFKPTSPADIIQIRPTQHLILEFPKDLDPTAGPRSLADENRRLWFTPHRVTTTTRADGTAEQSISIISRNGRVTSLLGLPRMNGLRAEVLGVGGGFPPNVLDSVSSSGEIIAVAGGTGAGCFFSVSSSGNKIPTEGSNSQNGTSKHRLLWSLRGDDFRLVEYVLERELIDSRVWMTDVFVTSGEEDDGLIAGKPVQFWRGKLSSMTSTRIKLHCRRMEEEDVFCTRDASHDAVLFCGSKSLEFQIKQWSLARAKVYVTERS